MNFISQKINKINREIRVRERETLHTLERGEMEKQRLVGTGERLKLIWFDDDDDDLDCDSESLLPSSPERIKIKK